MLAVFIVLYDAYKQLLTYYLSFHWNPLMIEHVLCISFLLLIDSLQLFIINNKETLSSFLNNNLYKRIMMRNLTQNAVYKKWQLIKITAFLTETNWTQFLFLYLFIQCVCVCLNKGVCMCVFYSLSYCYSFGLAWADTFLIKK